VDEGFSDLLWSMDLIRINIFFEGTSYQERVLIQTTNVSSEIKRVELLNVLVENLDRGVK